jgi:UDP-2,4-diacetamido-2,4,6-trideoxy-beta-L-altropyranose hydrolase
VVFDHFRLGADDHARLRGEGRVLMAVDDLADRPLDVDLLLDPGPARRPEDYAGLLPPATTILVGGAYALVRREFLSVRDASLARRSGTGEVGRVLVSLGLTDVGGITGTMVNRLLPRLGEARLDVVLGRDAPSLDALQRLALRDPRVSVHVETTDMAGLCAAADLAVGAGGSSLWERCAVGLPGVLVVLADNQVPGSAAAERAGAVTIADARAADFDAALDRAFTGLMRSPERRGRMVRAAAALCDGLGAERAADALLGLISARP